MERISNKHDENLPAATLYLDDVVEILDTFAKSCGNLEITSGEYKITDPSELPALASKFPSGRFDDMRIQGFKPFVSLELRAYGARTYISEDTIEQRVVVTSAREVLQRCRKFKPDTLANTAFFLLVALATGAYIAKFYIAFVCLVIAWLALLSFGTRFRMKYTIVVYTQNRSEAKSFWQRKKDDVLLAVIAAALGAAASYATTKLLPQTHNRRTVRPNPSLKLSTNGVSLWSPGAGPAAHFAPAAQRATPLAPAQLERQAAQAITSFIPSILKTLFIVLILLLAAVIIILYLKKQGLLEAKGSRPWPFYLKKPLTQPEQVLYHRLVKALPEHIVLAQVQVSRVLGVKKGSNFHEWNNRINRLSYDFVVCSKDSTVIAAIELDDKSHESVNRSATDKKKDKATADAGLRLIRWNVRSLPDEDAIKTQLRSAA